MGKGKFLKAAAAIAAIGGVCYVFRDKIKNSTVYQSLDVDDKVEKVKSTIKEKMPVKDESDRDYFSLDDTDASSDNADAASESSAKETENADAASESSVNGTENAGASSEDSDKTQDAGSSSASDEEAVTMSDEVSDVTAMVDDLISDIPGMNKDTASTVSDDSPILYENEGLSDVSEDLDVIEEQDKLDL